jgi:DNA repair exonuclease SbcCD ATPase subunit
VKAMTTAQDRNEPTLSDVIERLDKLAQSQEQLAQNQERVTQNQERLAQEQEKLIQQQEQFSQEQERFNERFSNYQQATQWVVQLAFTLIASATLTVIITSVLKR